MRRDRLRPGECRPLALSGLHHVDDRALRLQRPVGDERPVGPPQLRLHQVAVPYHPVHGLPNLPDRVAARRVRQRERLQLARREHRLPLLQMPHPLTHHLQRRGDRGELGRLALARHRRGGVQTELARPFAPLPLEDPPHRLRLLPAPGQRRDLRRSGGVRDPLLLQIRQQVPPPGRERRAQLRPVARDLEARNPPRHRRKHRIPRPDQAPRQLVPVIRPDQTRVAVQKRRLDALPAALGILRHVGDHRMRVKLRIEVAARDVAERRRHHRRRPHPRPGPRRRVPAPGLEQRRLDPVQRRPNRTVMRPDRRPVAARAVRRRQKRRQRHRLRRRERDVETRAVLVLPGPYPAEADTGPRNETLQQLLEHPGRNPRPDPQTQRRRARPVPRARLAVLLPLRPLLLRTLPVLQVITALVAEILRRRGRRSQIAYRRYHRRRILAGSEPGMRGKLMPNDADHRACFGDTDTGSSTARLRTSFSIPASSRRRTCRARRIGSAAASSIALPAISSHTRHRRRRPEHRRSRSIPRPRFRRQGGDRPYRREYSRSRPVLSPTFCILGGVTGRAMSSTMCGSKTPDTVSPAAVFSRSQRPSHDRQAPPTCGSGHFVLGSIRASADRQHRVDSLAILPAAMIADLGDEVIGCWSTGICRCKFRPPK